MKMIDNYKNKLKSTLSRKTDITTALECVTKR